MAEPDPARDERVLRLNTPQDCEQFALNVADRLPGLAVAARRRGITLQAEAHGAASAPEREALEAVYAYERALSVKTRASRTWPMIRKHGILRTIEKTVDRADDPLGYRLLEQLNLQDLAFEAIVLRHPEAFSEAAVERSRERLEAWRDSDA